MCWQIITYKTSLLQVQSMSSNLLEHKGPMLRSCKVTDGTCICSRLAKVQTEGLQSQGSLLHSGADQEWHDFFYEVCTRDGVPFTTACSCFQQLYTDFESSLDGPVEDSGDPEGLEDLDLEDSQSDDDDDIEERAESAKKNKYY